MTKLLITASILGFISGLFGVTWDEVDSDIVTDFPEVKFIQRGELLANMQDSNVALPRVFDVRNPDEFAVSHLPEATNLVTAAEIATEVHDADTPIVVYCSVGYRSAAVAAELQQLGFTNVRNLHHSLFEWANSGYPMVNAQGATPKVHPFNSDWAVLVEKTLRSYDP